jgi:hypothetical protein
MLGTLAKGGLIAAAGMFAIALLALGFSCFTPDPHAAPVRIVLGPAAPESVGEHTAILAGSRPVAARSILPGKRYCCVTGFPDT